MLFDSLDKLKRNSILSSLLLVALGIIILILPVEHVDLMLQALAYTMLILAVVMVLNFLTGKKSLMEYIKFAGALTLIIVGICVLLFRDNAIVVLACCFGALLILDGGRTMYHSFTYARLSGRKAWWVLSILSGCLITAGIIIFVFPAWDSPHTLLKVIGSTLVFAAVVSCVRLFWTWPIRRDEGGEVNEQQQ